MVRELQRAINLAKKTGDRLIIFDSARPDKAFVVMSLDEYEKIVARSDEVKNLTENQLLDRINRDIAVWKNEQYQREQYMKTDKDFFADSNKGMPSNRIFGKDASGREFDYSETVPDFFVSAEDVIHERREKAKKHWQIPKDRKDAAEEVIEEDRQYLEHIAF